MSEQRKLYCIHGTFPDHCGACQGQLLASLKQRIAELEAAQQWIPVSERLPPEGMVELYEAVIVDGPARWSDQIFWQMSEWETPECQTVEYWREVQPLPAPPEEQGK